MPKRCPRCDEHLPSDAFAKNRSRYDGLQAMCKSCYKDYRKERACTREPASKLCRKCDQTKPAEDFGKDTGKVDGLAPYCFVCTRAAASEAWKRRRGDKKCKRCKVASVWYKQFCEDCRVIKQREATRNWYYSDLERARRSGRRTNRKVRALHPERYRLHDKRKRYRRRMAPSLPYTVDEMEARLSMFGGCWMCGAPADTVDHVKPLARGGWDCLANLRPACVACNSSKKASWPVDTAVRIDA